MSKKPQEDSRMEADLARQELNSSILATPRWALYRDALSSYLFEMSITGLLVLTNEYTKKYFCNLLA